MSGRPSAESDLLRSPSMRCVIGEHRGCLFADSGCPCSCHGATNAHIHEWDVEYLPDPMSAGGVVRSGDLRCACGETIRDIPPEVTP
jgi:hypothetical protein